MSTVINITHTHIYMYVFTHEKDDCRKVTTPVVLQITKGIQAVPGKKRMGYHRELSKEEGKKISPSSPSTPSSIWRGIFFLLFWQKKKDKKYKPKIHRNISFFFLFVFHNFTRSSH